MKKTLKYLIELYIFYDSIVIQHYLRATETVTLSKLYMQGKKYTYTHAHD